MIKYCYDTHKSDEYEMIQTNEMSSKMKLLAGRFSANTGYSTKQMHFIPMDNHIVLGSVKADVSKETIQYIAEQYVITNEEMEEHLLDLPKIIEAVDFPYDITKDYSVDIDNFTYDKNKHRVSVPFDMVLKIVQAALQVLLTDKFSHLVIISEKWNDDFDFNSRNLMAMITSFLPIQARRKLSFTSYCNEKFGLPQLYKIIFCKSYDAVKLKSNKEFADSYFAFIDQNEIFPEIKQGAYVNYIVTHKEKSESLVSFIDQKVPIEVLNNLDIYDVICTSLFLKVNQVPDKYLPYRKAILKYLIELYAMEIIDNELIKFILYIEKELIHQMPPADLTKDLSLLVHFYNSNIIGMDVVFEFLLECTNVMKKSEIQEYVQMMGINDEYNKYLLDKGIFPDMLATQIADKIKETADLITLIDSTITQYGETILDHIIVQAAISEYLSTAVDYCKQNDSFTIVMEVSKNLNKYHSPLIDDIVFQVTDKISHKLEAIEEEKEFAKKQEKLLAVRKQVYSSFEKLFSLTELDKLLDVNILEDCAKIGISKYDLDGVAKECYRQTQSKLALLFLGMSYDAVGQGIGLDIYNIEEYLLQYNDANIMFELLLEVALDSKLLSLDFVVDSLAQYLSQNEPVYLLAKKHKGELWEFILTHVSVKIHNKKFLMMAGISVMGVLIIIGVALILTLTK